MTRPPTGGRGSYDVVIAGGGPAGLSAALWLARYRRTVCVVDAGPGRNQLARAVYGYPGLAEPTPADLRATLRDQAIREGADFLQGEVLAVGGEKGAFTVFTDDHALTAARVVLAYGLRDYIPAIRGIEELYGSAVFHCPDCDGPRVEGKRVGVIGWDRAAANLALYLLNWTDQVRLLAHGRSPQLPARGRRLLARNGIDVHTGTIERAVASEDRLRGVLMADSSTLELDALFFHLGTEPRCTVAQELGCRLDPEGYLDVDRGQETSVPGVHAAGDITGHPHLVVAAAAEGVRAALSIHRSLLPDSRHL